MQRPSAKLVRRAWRKHRPLLLAAAIVLGILLFPLLLGKRLSPNDIFFLYAPWAPAAHAPQNALMNDPATSYFTEAPMVRRQATFFWNPYIGSGTPGWHSAGPGLLSPFALLPALLLPLAWFYTALIVLKFLAGLCLAYGWLREERLGRGGAALGATVIAAAGASSAWWMWLSTNATVLAPAVLWIVARMRAGKRTPIVLQTLTALAILLSGFPAAILYVFYLGLAYVVRAAIEAPGILRVARTSVRATGGGRGLKSAPHQGAILSAVAAAALAVAIAYPALVPFAQMIRKSSYLELRKEAATTLAYPASQLLALVKPYRLIGPHGWSGDARLGRNNNFFESTIYVGKVTLLFALFAVIAGAGRRRFFWAAGTLVLLAAMFGVPVIRDAIAALPGMRFTPLTRLRLILPIGFGYLAASALRGIQLRMSRRAGVAIAYATVAVTALDLTLFVRSFTPYVSPREALPPEPPSIRWLHAQPKPFRVAALGTTLWPDTAEYADLEDIRSHYPVERAYRRLLAGIDPGSFGSDGNVILFHPERTKLDSEVFNLLNVRYLIEAPGSGVVDRAMRNATLPWVEVYRGSDAVIYRNVRALDRFFTSSPAGLSITARSPRDLRVDTDSRTRFLLMSSERLTDELRVTIDGRAVEPQLVQDLFAATYVPAGRHTVIYERRIPLARIVVSLFGLAALMAMESARLARTRRASRPALRAN